MFKDQPELQLFRYGIFALAALVILFEFLLPGTIINDEIIDLRKERQQYYNAARNYHYTYKVVTSEREFLVSKEFAKSELLNTEIEYSVSPIFNEVNWYRLDAAENRSFYSLRIASGFVLPLLTLITVFVAFRYKKKISALVLILQILLIADLIFLMT